MEKSYTVDTNDDGLWQQHDCIPGKGHWYVCDSTCDGQDPAPLKDIVFRGEVYHKNFLVQVHYIRFKNTILQIDGSTDEVIALWQRVEV